MTAYNIIMKKRRGEPLTDEEIAWFINGCTNGSIADHQTAALLMAICINGMNDEETAALTLSMARSGDMFTPSEELGHICIDKHSTGGVGDKVTLIAAPICASCGVPVPKMSGKGLGHTGGTIDKLEAIPGFNTNLTRDQFIDTIKKAGFSVASQTGSLVPADKKLYALRNDTATVDNISLICSSVMSKKIATGADGIVLDVKAGDGAFMKSTDDAVKLAHAMLKTAKAAGRKCTALITDMSKPLGMAVGNSIEVIEACEALKGNCPPDLHQVYMAVVTQMLLLGNAGATSDECAALAEKAVSSGRAFESFERMTKLQGGDPKALSDYSLLGTATEKAYAISHADGYISGISCEKTGLIALSLGAGRQTKDGIIDPTAGILFNCAVGDYVKKGDLLGTIMSSTVSGLDVAADEFCNVFSLSEEKTPIKQSVLQIITERNDS